MKDEELGFSPTTGAHSKLLTHTESVFVGTLWVDHVGEDNKVSGIDLAGKFAYGMVGLDLRPANGEIKEHWKREVRHMHNHLLIQHSNIPILSKAGYRGGYWIAGADYEAEAFYHTFRKRATTGFIKSTRGKRSAAIDAVEQLAFEFDDIVDKTFGIAQTLKRSGSHMAPEIVDALLSKMARDPEKFADEIRKLRDKYFSGAVILEKERLEAIKTKTRELQDMVGVLAS